MVFEVLVGIGFSPVPWTLCLGITREDVGRGKDGVGMVVPGGLLLRCVLL